MIIGLIACSSAAPRKQNLGATQAGSGGFFTGTAGVGFGASGTGAGVGAGTAGTLGTAGVLGASGVGGEGAAGFAGVGATAGTGAAGSGGPMLPLGPEDGDPNQPVIAISEVACGGPSGGFGLGSANFKIDNRDMIVTYPCNKHAGAPATFILNLHGTTPVNLHFYQHAYFSAHQFAASHNLIIVTPSSVVEQWGNMDNGQDEPHLMKIVEWVYANLNGAGKFDIRGMWVGGHSWGGMYTAKFGCKPELADKVKGLIMMSGGGISGFSAAACASKVAVIQSTAEGDNRMPGDQTSLATGHGCGAMQTEMILNNVHTFWPTCSAGFVHANYYMQGKQHETNMDKEVVQSIVDWIKASRI